MLAYFSKHGETESCVDYADYVILTTTEDFIQFITDLQGFGAGCCDIQLPDFSLPFNFYYFDKELVKFFCLDNITETLNSIMLNYVEILSKE